MTTVSMHAYGLAPSTDPAKMAERIGLSLARALALAEAGHGAAGDHGDYGSRLLRMAGECLTRAQSLCRPSDQAMHQMGRELFDAQALLQGCGTMHDDDPRGLLASTADEMIEALHEWVGAPNFWPDDATAERALEPAPLLLLSDRTRVAWDAACQVEVLTAQLLRDSQAQTDSAELCRKAMLVRMLGLGSVVLSVMGGDDNRPTDELRDVVHGQRYLQTDADAAAPAVQAD